MGFDLFYPDELSRQDQSKLMNGTVVPRPIAWVSTVGSAGVNLAPFSYFNVVSVQPCIVMFSVATPLGPRTGSVKDTLQNLEEVPEFVLHLVDRSLAEQMNLTSGELPRGTNEFEVAKLTEVPSQVVKPPRIKEAGVHMECKVHDIISLGEVPYKMVLGHVVAIHTRESLVNERYHVDPEKHRPIARLGGPSLYTEPTDTFGIGRPD